MAAKQTLLRLFSGPFSKERIRADFFQTFFFKK